VRTDDRAGRALSTRSATIKNVIRWRCIHDENEESLALVIVDVDIQGLVFPTYALHKCDTFGTEKLLYPSNAAD